ncbi:MAG: hypothetical protein GY951_14985 [Psychromonas sp.]|jgi:hypothetical protein|nr:hypothetical protein [Psychromonas sp.]
MVKFINLLVNGAITPINVEDVVKVVADAKGGNASTVTLTYKSAATLVITAEAGAGKGFGSGSATSAANVVKGFWGAIIDASSQPWNLVEYPSAGEAWTASYAPASQGGDYRKQSANPAGSATFAGKQTQMIQNDADIAIVWASVA